jgi:hypothetical protein
MKNIVLITARKNLIEVMRAMADVSELLVGPRIVNPAGV